MGSAPALCSTWKGRSLNHWLLASLAGRRLSALQACEDRDQKALLSIGLIAFLALKARLKTIQEDRPLTGLNSAGPSTAGQGLPQEHQPDLSWLGKWLHGHLRGPRSLQQPSETASERPTDQDISAHPTPPHQAERELFLLRPSTSLFPRGACEATCPIAAHLYPSTC